jgi:TolB-like protein
MKTPLNRRQIVSRAWTLATSAFTLWLLGVFALKRADGTALALPTRKAQLLLAYLALPAGQAHPRETLASLFWADRGDEQARGSLRNALAAIRAALGAASLTIDRDTVALAKGALATDVDLLAAARSYTVPPEGAVEAALRGELLAGRNPPSETFAEWLSFERNRCRGLAMTVMQQAIAAKAGERQWAEAIALAERLVALDPLRERSHRLLIGLLADSGERSLALARLQSCKDVLKRELGVEPSPETLALAARFSDETRRPEAPPRDPPTTRFSVAVLPFIAADPAQKSLAEGFSEDLITELSRAKDFAVIARNSAYLFSGRPETAAAAAAELAARYALTGSLRRAGERLRVTAQLTDAAQNRCIWAERYDRDMTDLFAVEDEVVASIMGQVDATMRQDERERVAHRAPTSLDAWELFHRGLWHVYRFERAELETAETLFRRAAELAPALALPRAGLGYAAFVKCSWFFVTDPGPVVAEGIGHATAAVEYDPEGAFGRVVLGRLLILSGDLAGAMHHLERAIATNPSFAQAHFGLAHALAFAGRPDEALLEIERALRLSPKDPLASMFMTLSSFCHMSLGNFVAAESAARTATQLNSREIMSRLALAVSLVQLGRLAEAKIAAAEAQRIEPNLTLENFSRLLRHTPKPVHDLIRSSLDAAGLSA